MKALLTLAFQPIFKPGKYLPVVRIERGPPPRSEVYT
jgi:hypothetical protein